MLLNTRLLCLLSMAVADADSHIQWNTYLSDNLTKMKKYQGYGSPVWSFK